MGHLKQLSIIHYLQGTPFFNGKLILHDPPGMGNGTRGVVRPFTPGNVLAASSNNTGFLMTSPTPKLGAIPKKMPSPAAQVLLIRDWPLFVFRKNQCRFLTKFRFGRLPIFWSVQSTRKVKPRKRKRIAMTPFTNVPDWRPVNYAEAAAWKCETPFSWRATSNPHPDPVWPTKSPFLSTPIYSTIKKLLA